MLREIIEDAFGIKLPRRSALWGIIYNTVLLKLLLLKGDDEYFQASMIANDLEKKIQKYIEENYVEK